LSPNGIIIFIPLRSLVTYGEAHVCLHYLLIAYFCHVMKCLPDSKVDKKCILLTHQYMVNTGML